MAKEIMLEDGRTALFDDDATEQEINQKLQSSGLKRQAGPSQPKDYPSVQQMGPAVPAMASLANSLAFGVPEMAARAMGGGQYIDAVRQEYPMATTAGDVLGLANPARLAAKAGTAGVKRMMSGPGVTEEILRRPAGTGPGIAQTARNVAERTAGVGTGIMGAQAGAAALGGARSENYGAGAQQGAQTFRTAAINAPGISLVPGAQGTIGAVTGVVPGVLGGGAAMANYLSIDEMIRQEAAKRALQGPR
ncbi:hypothetical protein UFOVP841_9 [uncultured Caudovirales phage]|uniref:Uncharacterized protein n=1 Tax=uncultured Caudovirales phage TaxID=2100421 RepID=A0A6J5P4G5_9CAUD|nr:hypothetical protein UFOVP841_9 [uncultured Caudovirales phage]